MPTEENSCPVLGEAPVSNQRALSNIVPGWSTAEVRSIQTELARMGLYSSSIDGQLGGGTQAGLVEAFGSDQWRLLPASTVQSQLSTAPRQPSQGFRYGEMFKDGLLDISLGMGFDETGADQGVYDQVDDMLAARRFENNASMAARWYSNAGRPVAHSATGEYHCKPSALVHRPPVGEPRPVNAVVRLINGRNAGGAEAAGAFREGMVESDAAYYAGHGRYGSGPDFDGAMTIELLDANGHVERTLQNYSDLEPLMEAEGQAAGRSAWNQFLWRARRNQVRTSGGTEGNIFLNPTNAHTGEFGARLMYWHLEQHGVQAQTGAEGPLAEQAEASDQNYTIWVFNGCRTLDYRRSFRSTLNARRGDLIGSNRTLYWADQVRSMGAFLDSVLAQQSAEETVAAQNEQQVTERPGTTPSGFERH